MRSRRFDKFVRNKFEQGCDYYDSDPKVIGVFRKFYYKKSPAYNRAFFEILFN